MVVQFIAKSQKITSLVLIGALILLGVTFNTGVSVAASTTTKASSSKTTTSVAAPSFPTPQYDLKTGLYGYVNIKGQYVVPPQFYNASPFSESLAAVNLDEEDEKLAYINLQGKIVFKTNYFTGGLFKNGKAVVLDRMGKAFIIDKNGKLLVDTQVFGSVENRDQYMAVLTRDHIASSSVDNKYGLVLKAGEVILPEYAGLPIESNGFTILYKDLFAQDGQLNIITSTGKQIKINGKFESTTKESVIFSYSAPSSEKYLTKSRVRYGYITSKGTVIKTYTNTSNQTFTFFWLRPMTEGLGIAIINHEPEYGANFNLRAVMLKTTGEPVNPFEYQRLGFLSEGLMPAYSTYSYGYIDKKGEWILPEKEVIPATKIDPSLSKYIDDTALSQEEYDFVVAEGKKIVKATIKPGMTDRQKVEALYEYVATHVVYDHENYSEGTIPRASYSVLGALKYSICVCEGYSECMQLLLGLSGIDNYKVVGTNKKLEGHAWNLVLLDGKYYHLDATWDEQLPKGSWRYFLKSDKVFEKDHIWPRESFPQAL